MSEPRDLRRKYKRLCILSDGTWQTMENPVPTNILKLSVAIDAEDSAGIQQLVFYDAGIGTDNGVLDRAMGGVFGAGIDKNIIQLYTFLALNYEDGDEIYMFGFSRGAYTVRSVAGMMSVVGLVRRKDVQNIQEAYDLYRNRSLDDPDPKACQEFRAKFGTHPPIKLLMCFDTVGSLGLPFAGLPGAFDSKKYRFHNITLNDQIENAIHCLSVGEQTFGFSPTPMDFNESVGEKQLSQKYFWGQHGGIGGGDRRMDQIESAKVTLLWTVAEMERRGIPLAIDKSELPDSVDMKIGEAPKPGGLFGFLNQIGPKTTRDIPSIEHLHEGVAIRYKAVSDYRPDSLKKFHEELSK